MKSLHEFRVKGSAEEPYTIVFRRQGVSLNGYCNCPAGKKGQMCKHRINILKGSDKGVVDPDPVAIGEVVSWLSGSDIEQPFAQIQKMEGELDVLKKELDVLRRHLTRAKKGLARSMRD